MTTLERVGTLYDPVAHRRIWDLYRAMNDRAREAYYAASEAQLPAPTRERVPVGPKVFLVQPGSRLGEWRRRDVVRREQVASVRCATCSADIGNPCFSRSGGEILSVSNWHDSRQRANGYRTGV